MKVDFSAMSIMSILRSLPLASVIATAAMPAVSQDDISGLRVIHEGRKTFGDWIVRYSKNRDGTPSNSAAIVAAPSNYVAWLRGGNVDGILMIACSRNSADLRLVVSGAPDTISVTFVADNAPIATLSLPGNGAALSDFSVARGVARALRGKHDLYIAAEVPL